MLDVANHSNDFGHVLSRRQPDSTPDRLLEWEQRASQRIADLNSERSRSVVLRFERAARRDGYPHHVEIGRAHFADHGLASNFIRSYADETESAAPAQRDFIDDRRRARSKAFCQRALQRLVERHRAFI